ncbi:MAG: hypothetical protein AAB284_04670 [Chloroflexota bacterium]
MSLDFEQLAFIEKWRQRAARGPGGARDGRRGDLVAPVRVGDLGELMDMRGRDATGAMRKARLSLGDRVFVAIEYAAQDVVPGSGGTSVSGGTVGPGAVVEGTVKSIGEVTVVDCGAEVLVRGDTIQGVAPGESVRFAIADEGKAYLIPTR